MNCGNTVLPQLTISAMGTGTGMGTNLRTRTRTCTHDKTCAKPMGIPIPTMFISHLQGIQPLAHAIYIELLGSFSMGSAMPHPNNFRPFLQVNEKHCKK
jgi:hypothetical protein